MSKREWWILGADDLSKTSIALHTKPKSELSDAVIHVIDHDSYLAVVAERDRLAKALEVCAGMANLSGSNVSSKNIIAVVKEALKGKP